MKALCSIIRLEWCAAIRSRAVLLLSLASLAWVIAAPFVLTGDGTESGWFEMRVRYSLAAVFCLTLVSLAATAAGSLSKDRANKRLQLTLVRPVPYFIVALGRMIALSALGAAVLALAALTLRLTMASSLADDGYGATCDHVLDPVLESPTAAIEKRLSEIREHNPELLEKMTENEARRYLLQYETSRYQTVRPGETNAWAFATDSISDASEVAVRIRLTDALGRLEQTDGVFRLGDREGRIAHVNKTLVKVPLWRTGNAPEGDLGQTANLTLENRGARGVSLCPYRDLQLLVRADSFGWNLFRGWLEMSALVALVVALAIFLGACLGRSVAVFSVLALLFIMSVSPALVEDYPDPSSMTLLDRVSLRLTETAARATRPLSAYTPIAHLESTSCIEWKEVGEAIGWNMLVLPLVFSLLAGLVMARKQDAR